MMAGFCFVPYAEVSVVLIQEKARKMVMRKMTLAAQAAGIMKIGDTQVAVTEAVTCQQIIATCQLYLVCSRSLRQRSLPSNQAQQIRSTVDNAGR
jgi:hypothetical protein